MLDSSGSEPMLLPAHSGHSCFLEAPWNKDVAQAPTEDPKFRCEDFNNYAENIAHNRTKQICALLV
jgi:hypothetical protein